MRFLRGLCSRAVTLMGGGGAPTTDALLREDADYILREDGDKILLD